MTQAMKTDTNKDIDRKQKIMWKLKTKNITTSNQKEKKKMITTKKYGGSEHGSI